MLSLGIAFFFFFCFLRMLHALLKAMIPHVRLRVKSQTEAQKSLNLGLVYTPFTQDHFYESNTENAPECMSVHTKSCNEFREQGVSDFTVIQH